MKDAVIDSDRLIARLTGHASDASVPFTPNWERAVELAERHSVAEVLYACVKQGSCSPPPSVVEELRRTYLSGAARNVRRFLELSRILGAFRTASIAVIPLKGAFLAEAVYADIALRPMSDVDLLVPLPEMARSLETLRALGYASDYEFDHLAEEAISQHMPLMHGPNGVVVELHWTIVDPLLRTEFRETDLQGVWDRAVLATVAGVPVQALCPTDLLLQLCLHVAAQHRFDGATLQGYVDMAAVVKRYGDAIDWEAFASRARNWRIANGVQLALLLAAEWTNLVCPGSALAALNADPVSEETLKWVRHKTVEGSSRPLESNAMRLGDEAGVNGKLSALRDAILPARTAMGRMYVVPANSSRVFAYYPVRIKDLFVRYHGTLWQFLRRDKAFMRDARNEARLRAYLGWR
jgi:hypothetical protein